MSKRLRKKWLKKKGLYINPRDAWNLDIDFAEFAIPRLKMLRENYMGYPGKEEIDTPEKWEAILDKIILAFELYIDMSDMDDKYFQYDEDGKLSEESLALAESDNTKIDEGLALFAKWFRYL